MPIYDYRCDHCGHAFSAVRAYTDDTAVLCPSCGDVPRRLMSMPAIVFKGSGWYKTDSRPAPPSGSDRPAAPAGDGAAKTSDAGGAAAATPSDAADAKKSDKGDKSDKTTTTSKPGAPAPAAKSEAASS